MHIISVACLGFLTLYFLADSLVQRTMVETMKMVANPAREAMMMRQFFTTPRLEQGWASVLGASRGALVVVGVDLVLGAQGIKIPAGLEDMAVVVVMAESVENDVAGGSAVELDPAVSANCDVEMWVLVTEAG